MEQRRNSFDYEDLLACGRGELFGPGNAQLPLPPMLMFDRITSIGEDGGEHGKGHVRAELDVRPDLWFFPCHFKGDPVMPGCLGVDAMWQMVGFFLGWLGAPGRGRALGVGEVKFADQVLPTVKKVVYGVDFKRVFRSKLVLGIADGWLEADGRRIYEAKDLRVGLFKPDLWFFPCHFKGDPVMPGCLGLDALWQLLGFFLGWSGSSGKGRALGMGEVKFSGQVLPSMKEVVYGIEIKRVMRSKLVLGIADGWLSADGQLIYRASDLKVGLFKDEPSAA